MNWKLFFFRFFRNLVVGLVLGIVILGGLGYLLAGTEGLINMVYWGMALGLMGGFSSGLGMIFQAKFWSEDGNYKIFPEWNLFVKRSNDDQERDH